MMILMTRRKQLVPIIPSTEMCDFSSKIDFVMTYFQPSPLPKKKLAKKKKEVNNYHGINMILICEKLKTICGYLPIYGTKIIPAPSSHPGPAEEPSIQKATDRFTTVDIHIFGATGSQLFEDFLQFLFQKKVPRMPTKGNR